MRVGSDAGAGGALGEPSQLESVSSRVRGRAQGLFGRRGVRCYWLSRGAAVVFFVVPQGLDARQDRAVVLRKLDSPIVDRRFGYHQCSGMPG